MVKQLICTQYLRVRFLLEALLINNNNMIYIIAIIYIIGIFISYKLITSKWDNSKASNIYFSIIWIAWIPLYIIHRIHNISF